MKKFLKRFGVLFFTIGILVYTRIAIDDTTLLLPMLLMDALFCFFIYLLLRKKKPQRDITVKKQTESPSFPDKSITTTPIPSESRTNIADLFAVSNSMSPNVEDKDGLTQIQVLKKSSYPSKQGLYPHEIVMLSYADRFKTSNNSFQKFWYYEYGIRHPQKLLSSLETKGFICQGSISESLQLYKVSELKTILEKHNLKKSGTKSALIERLLHELSENELNEFTVNRLYSLTEKGKKELSDNEYITYLAGKNPRWHSSLSSMGINIWTVNKQLHEHPDSSYRDIIWLSLNQQVTQCLEQANQFNNWGPYILLKMTMYHFLQEEGRRTNAYNCYIEALYYKFFCAVNLYLSEIKYSDGNDHNTFYTEIKTEITDLFILEQIKSSLDLSNQAFVDYLFHKFQKYIPSNAFTPIQVANYLVAELSCDAKKSKQICADIEQKLLRSANK